MCVGLVVGCYDYDYDYIHKCGFAFPCHGFSYLRIYTFPCHSLNSSRI